MKKNYTINIQVPVGTFWRVIVPVILLIAAAGVLFGMLVVDRLVMPRIVGVDRDLLAVPDVTGMSLENGRDKILEVGLRCEIKAREYNDQVTEGYLISQFPEAGFQVKKGRLIDITISRGPKTGAVPQVKGLNDRQARIELRKHGFDIGRIKKIYDDSIPKDLAVRTEPDDGTIISKEMNVDLMMSNGPRPTHAEVPNIVGESIENARTVIEESGLKLGKTEYANNQTVQPGTVISQSVSPGASVPLDSELDIIVAVRKK